MYNTNDRQYIFKQSNGVVWNFFYDDKLGICYSTMNKRSNWTNAVSLHKNAIRHFFADMDREDRFHTLFQDNQGTMHYSCLDGDSIKSIPVLNSKTPLAYNKHLYLIAIKNNIHIFYVLQHEGSYIFAYQILHDGKINNPKVIDYVADCGFPYSIIFDKAFDIYAFYQSSDGKYLQIGYKKYNILQKFWSEFTPVTKYADNCEYPRTIMDNNNIIHLCYQRHTTKHFEMVYQQKVPDKNLWTNEVIVHSSTHSFENASILSLDDNIIIYWIREGVIYCNTGNQSGNSWGKPLKYNYPANKQFVCMFYKTNNIYEEERIAAKDIPGSFIGGLKFAFYQQSSVNGDNLSVEELKTLILDSLKLLKTSVEELKETDNNFMEEIAKLNNRYDELEKELVKCSVKSNYLETQLSQAKSFNTRLDTISSELRQIRSRMDMTDQNTIIKLT